MIMGDPARASMVANAASSVLGPDDVVKRLLDILRSLGGLAKLKWLAL